MNKKILILGTGISGLATAHWLKKDGYDVTLLEAKSEPGGAMETTVESGFLIDYGPNSGLETTPLIRKLAADVGIEDQMVYANEEGNKRYILRDGKLHPLPTSPPAFLKSKLFSTKAKVRLAAEPFIGRSQDGYYQSISEFVKRRLGQEFLDYAINPFVSGVFAGDPDKLSVKSAFPKLYRLEEVYGGLIKGMIKGAKERKQRAEESKQSAKMFSFINGMQTFPVAIAKQFEGSIIYDAVINDISKSENGYRVTYFKEGNNETLETPMLLSTIPAHVLSPLVLKFDENLKSHLDDIYYPPVMVLYLGYHQKAIGQPLDGFGYLIPSLEKRKFLGAIWSSVIFPNRAPEGYAAFTLFIGGTGAPHLFEADNEKLINEVIGQFSRIMKVKEEPVLRRNRFWKKAIPQYNLGYVEHENYFERFEQNNPGFFLSGNFRGGISVGDCVKNSDVVFNRIKKFLNRS